MTSYKHDLVAGKIIQVILTIFKCAQNFLQKSNAQFIWIFNLKIECLMMNQKIHEIMNPSPVVTYPSKDLKDISHEMLDSGLQQLPVVENGNLVGILTTYDMWRQYENKTTVQGLTVGEVMNTKIVKIGPNDKIGTAAELFADGRFKTIPVVTESGEFKGTITAFDIIKKVFNSEYNNAILFEKKFNE